MAESGSSTGPSAGRMACAFCRKRKLKCDRQTPKCESCQKFGYVCEYGPPRIHSRKDTRTAQNTSYVRKLEDRLGRVEELLRTQQHGPGQSSTPGFLTNDSTVQEKPADFSLSPAAIQDLEILYFKFIHPWTNLIHPGRYMHSLNPLVKNQPPIYLRYALCALAAPASTAHSHLAENLYQTARRHLQEAELATQELEQATLPHAQTWVLISIYELKQGYLQRAWMSTSRAITLVHMMRLHRIDGLNVYDPSLELIPRPRDWTEAEERRRLFWLIFLMDRYACISMNWPTMMNEKDIRTFLPASNEAYENCAEESTIYLSDALAGQGSNALSSFAAHIVVMAIGASKLGELQRFDPSSLEEQCGNTWVRSSRLDSVFASVFGVPEHLTMPNAKLDPGTLILNMSASTATILVHRFARIQANQDPVSTKTISQSTTQCIDAAANILQLMKMSSHWDLNTFHFGTPLPLYAGAITFAECWTLAPDDLNENALRFLTGSLRKFAKITKVAGTLLADIDIEYPGILGRLDERLESSQSTDFLDFDFADYPGSEDMFERLFEDGHHEEEEQTESMGQSNDHSQDMTVTWTVDDPDIMSVARYL